jgi:hypothetical protein
MKRRKTMTTIDGDEETVVIRILGLISGVQTTYDGQYVVEYDPGRPGVEPGTERVMMCHLVATPALADATRFSVTKAFELWRSVDPENPVRSDGLPNRPLTAFNVEIFNPEKSKE